MKFNYEVGSGGDFFVSDTRDSVTFDLRDMPEQEQREFVRTLRLMANDVEKYFGGQHE